MEGDSRAIRDVGHGEVLVVFGRGSQSTVRGPMVLDHSHSILGHDQREKMISINSNKESSGAVECSVELLKRQLFHEML
eukprot:509343-Hanusia_phi.AAC.2